MTGVDRWLMAVGQPLRAPILRPHLFVALAATVVFALTVIYALPTQLRYSEAQDALAAARQRWSAVAYEQELAKAYAVAARTLPAVEVKLQHKAPQLALVKQLPKLAARHRVRILAQSYETAKTKDEYALLRLTLGVEATYPDLRAFLAAFDELETLSVVEEGSFARAEGRRIKATLKIGTYARL